MLAVVPRIIIFSECLVSRDRSDTSHQPVHTSSFFFFSLSLGSYELLPPFPTKRKFLISVTVKSWNYTITHKLLLSPQVFMCSCLPLKQTLNPLTPAWNLRAGDPCTLTLQSHLNIASTFRGTPSIVSAVMWAELRWGRELTKGASWRLNRGVLASATSTLSVD